VRPARWSVTPTASRSGSASTTLWPPSSARRSRPYPREAMDRIAFEHHLTSPQGHRRRPDGAFTATVGGFACCDEIEIALKIEGDRVADAGFDAHGCGATTAAGSAVVTLVRDTAVFDAARI